MSSGEPARVGLSSSAAIPAAILKKLETEEELEEVLGHSSEDKPVPCSSVTEVGAQEQVDSLQETRDVALVSKKRAADSMVLQSLKKKKALDGDLVPGQSILVNVSEFDRGKTDARNPLSLISEIIDQQHGGVVVQTAHGQLDRVIYANQYTIPSEQLLDQSDVKSEPVISIREAVCLQSLTG